MVMTLLAGAAMVCGGCHSDAPLPPFEGEGHGSETPDPEKLTLCLNVTVDEKQSGSRADNAPDGYEVPSGDFEKISTLRVIIIRNLSDDKTKGVVEANRLVTTNDQGKPIYDDLEFKVIANEEKRIFLIANEAYLTAPTGFNNPSKFLDTFTVRNTREENTVDLSALTDWTVSVPGLTETTTEIKGYSNGLFSPSVSRRLPLTEYFDIVVNRDEKIFDDTFYSYLFLTRAAAKAVFYLNTSDNFTGEDVKNTYITAISLSGVGATEYVFPKDAEYSPSKEKLISISTIDYPSTSIKKEAYITNFAVPNDNKQLTYLLDDISVEIEKPADGQPRLITPTPIYFPESILEPGEHYTVGVRLSNGNWVYSDLDEKATQHNILSIKEGDIERDAIARNTYLPIVLNFDSSLDLTVNVLPWDREDHYVDYTANVGIIDEDCLDFSGIEGQSGDYLSLDKNTAQLVLNYGKVAQGSFTIASPKGETWDAYLITTGGTTDAIQFQIPDPDDKTKTITTTHISGIIGEKANFGIVATVAPGTQQNSAQLIVMATLATGTQVIVDVLKSWESETGILTVIENPNQ